MGPGALTIAAVGVVKLRLAVNRVDFDVVMTFMRLIDCSKKKIDFC